MAGDSPKPYADSELTTMRDSRRCMCVVAMTAMTMLFLAVSFLQQQPSSAERSARQLHRSDGAAVHGDAQPYQLQQEEGGALVVFAFANLSAMHDFNLRFFLRHGVIDDPSMQYVIVCNEHQNTGYPCLQDMTNLPANVKVLRRENHCMDLGSWLHGLEHTPQRSYKAYIFMNASVRGPLMPSSLASVIGNRWDKVFTSALDDDVKMVGMSVNCGGEGEYAHPHVQSMLWAVDAVGLAVLQASPAFTCDDDWYDKVAFIQNHEMGFSRAILEAGYNIGSLLFDQHGLDFRDPANWKCFGRTRLSVWTRGGYLPGGLDVHPLETLFFKTNRNIQAAALAAYTKVMDDRWSRMQSPQRIVKELPFPPRPSRDVDFTIVVSVGKAWGKLSTCFESILRQQAVIFEIVVVDDGSDPAAGKQLYAYQNGQHIPQLKRLSFRVVTVASDNRFLSALQRGSQLARGNYMVILDANAKFAESTLQDLRTMFNEDNSLDLIASDRRFKDFLSQGDAAGDRPKPYLAIRKRSASADVTAEIQGKIVKSINPEIFGAEAS